jgi:hypothetical protein
MEILSRRRRVTQFCYRALVATGHIFSPNEREAASLVGAGTPLELIGRLSKLGAQVYLPIHLSLMSETALEGVGSYLNSPG